MVSCPEEVLAIGPDPDRLVLRLQMISSWCNGRARVDKNINSGSVWVGQWQEKSAHVRGVTQVEYRRSYARVSIQSLQSIASTRL